MVAAVAGLQRWLVALEGLQKIGKLSVAVVACVLCSTASGCYTELHFRGVAVGGCSGWPAMGSAAAAAAEAEQV